MVNLTLATAWKHRLTSVWCRVCLHQQAPTQAVINKFTEVFLLFGKCHAVYNGNGVDGKAITQLGKIDITNNL